MIFLNTALLPLKPLFLLPEDAQPGHAAHQQRRDAPAERPTITTWSQHKTRLTEYKIHLELFIPHSIYIKVNSNFFRNLAGISTFHALPITSGTLAKPLLPYRARQRKKEKWLHQAEFYESKSNPGQKPSLKMTRAESQNSYLLLLLWPVWAPSL